MDTGGKVTGIPSDAIIKEIGGDENRVVVPTLQMLREEGVIKEIQLNKWKITLKGG